MKVICFLFPGLCLLSPILCAKLGSDAMLLVRDSSGRRVGALYENGNWVTYSEIPRAWYSGLGSHPQYVVIPDPETGAYSFVITGKEAGSFQLAATSVVEGSPVATQQYSGTIKQGESQELSADVSGRSIENLRVIPWQERYQPWLVYGAFGLIAVSVLTVYARRIRRKRQRKSRLEPKVSDVAAGPRIIEVTSAPRIIEIKEEE